MKRRGKAGHVRVGVPLLFLAGLAGLLLPPFVRQVAAGCNAPGGNKYTLGVALVSGPDYVCSGGQGIWTVNVSSDPAASAGTVSLSGDATGSAPVPAGGGNVQIVATVGSTASTSLNDKSVTINVDISADANNGPCKATTSDSFTILKVESVEIYKPETSTDADWQNSANKMAWAEAIFRDEPVKMRLVLSTAIPSLDVFPCQIHLRTYSESADPEDWKLVTLNTDDRLSPDKKEIWVTVTGAEVISLGLLPSANDDGVEEFTTADRIADPSDSNHNDGNKFDADMAGAGKKRRGKARDNGNINADPPECAVNKDYMQAAGVLYLVGESGGTKSEKRQIQNQADWLYYSGHGSHDSGKLLGGDILPSEAQNKWDKDLDTVVIAGCAVLDIKDYNDRCSGASHTASPGEKWAAVGPKRLLGYCWTAPIDVQGGDPHATATIVHDWFTGGASVASWINANDKEMGYNACAIDLTTTPWEYRYFHRVWQWIPPGYVYEKSTVQYDTTNNKWPDTDPNY